MVKIKNIQKAAERLKEAVDQGDKIILYGDSDLDGTSSTVILKETVEILGGKVFAVYFPDRGKEGYGLNREALDYLKKKAGRRFLLVLLDCGITSFEESKEAERSGIEVMIIDHHQPLEKLPKASIIVDPKQKGDRYPFKNLANTGIVFKLAEEILKEDLSEDKRGDFLELTALATIADMMEQKEDNEMFIEKGLRSLENTGRTGLKVLKERFLEKGLSTREISQRIISALNASEISGHKTKSFRLLTSGNERTAKRLADELFEESRRKHSKIDGITEELEKKIPMSDALIFQGDAGWDLFLLGSVASKLCNKFKKPVFLFRKGKELSRGAVRTPSGMNAVDIMQKCSHYLESFGGHPPAAGFSVKNENIEKFKDCLNKTLF